MGLVELFVLAIGVSMDACAVAICKGLALPKATLKNGLWIGLWFGIFQGLMPLAGYFLGISFKDYITAFDHWIAFGLLLFLGGKMIKEALSHDEMPPDASLSCKNMLILAIATSIDAMAVGVTFAFLNVQIVPAVCFIGLVTFALSAVGVKIGSVFGAKFKSKAELVGGIILILIGIKILLEHLNVF